MLVFTLWNVRKLNYQKNFLTLIPLLNMFELICNNNFLKKNFTDLFFQKNIPIAATNNQLSNQITLKTKNDEYLFITFNKNIMQFKLPIRFELIFSDIFFLLSDYELLIGSLTFNPLKQTISNKEKKINLRHTHSIILSKLLSSKNNSIVKFDLYNFFWPKDKNPQYNKLDTHLTNLKNLFFEEFEYDLKIKTENGILTLVN